MYGRSQSNAIVAAIIVLITAIVVGAAIPLLSGGRSGPSVEPGWSPPPTRLGSATPLSRRPIATHTASASTSLRTPAGQVTGVSLPTVGAQATLPSSPTLTPGPEPILAATVTFSPVPTSSEKRPIITVVSSPTLSAPISSLQAGPSTPAESSVDSTPASPIPSAAGPVSSPSPTPRPQPTATPVVPVAVSPPALVSPDDGAAQRGVVQFEWLPAGPLPEGAGYEVVWWNPDEPPDAARGLAPPTQASSQELNIDALFLSNQVPSGRLFWTVLIVRLQPYARLTQPGQSPQHRLVYAAEAPVAPVVPAPPRP